VGGNKDKKIEHKDAKCQTEEKKKAEATQREILYKAAAEAVKRTRREKIR